ncbi:MAG: nitrous oxide reductase accessory protein NosL [Rhodoferax sp.]|uniref:nitrous oxide reductase accessory protein NosL n=1 Tax=Rhodoferax sp. TaxID=50421 RepID=UPI002621E69B|nr:nitrous oxide reductase accessory protein NosL [Rhodoferax sp.]MDD2881126.1 nitrous oxide reductase accessory protein NosL [Rhodoferax sp.]
MKFTCSCRRHTPVDETCGERRQLLGLAVWASLGALGGLAACSDRSGEHQALVPVEIDASTTCELDGMLLLDYPGPKGQIHYAGAPAPVFFCDTVELFNTMLQPEQVRKVMAVYVQDMGKTDWEQPRGNWMDATNSFYVLGSKRHGSMGPTIASFADESEAKKFAEQWGGKLLRYAEVKPEMVDMSGGALHDSKM